MGEVSTSFLDLVLQALDMTYLQHDAVAATVAARWSEGFPPCRLPSQDEGHQGVYFTNFRHLRFFERGSAAEGFWLSHSSRHPARTQVRTDVTPGFQVDRAGIEPVTGGIARALAWRTAALRRAIRVLHWPAEIACLTETGPACR